MTKRANPVQVALSIFCALLAFIPFYGFGYLIAGVNGSWWLALIFALVMAFVLWRYWLALATTIRHFLFMRKA